MAGPSGKSREHAARSVRLAAALRENLKRRKAQARGRTQSGDEVAVRDEAADAQTPAPDFRRNRGRE
jgi:hypothetical protein